MSLIHLEILSIVCMERSNKFDGFEMGREGVYS